MGMFGLSLLVHVESTENTAISVSNQNIEIKGYTYMQ